MNKFAVTIFLALASTQLILASPIDDEEGFSAVAAAAESDPETASLLGNERLFTDFCHQERDYVINDMKQTARGISSFLFKLFFNQANEIAEDVINVEKKAVEDLSQQLQSPDTPVSSDKLSEDQVAEIIARGREQIAAKSDPSYGLLPATMTAVSAITSTLNTGLFRNIAKARSFMKADTLVQAFRANCDKVAEYERAISEKLEGAKAELSSSASPDVQNFLSTVSINSLHCQTTKNVVRLHAFCELVANGQGPFLKMLGFSQ